MNKVFLSLLVVGSLLLSCTHAPSVADYRVVPLPQDIVMTDGGRFALSEKTAIVCQGDGAMMRNAQFLAEYVKEKTGLDLAVTTAPVAL